jgi:GxxExxY protein
MTRQDAETPRRQEPDESLDNLAHAFIGAGIEVHRQLGPGFPESVYEQAMCIELTARSIPFERQASVQVAYKGQQVGEGRIDLWIDRQLVVELKAVDTLLPKPKAQGKAYLCATGNHLALVINFNEAVLRDGIHRVVLSDHSAK